jgi:hypothetical protein
MKKLYRMVFLINLKESFGNKKRKKKNFPVRLSKLSLLNRVTKTDFSFLKGKTTKVFNSVAAEFYKERMMSS